MADQIVFDAWTSLSFKRSLGSKRQGGVSWAAPTWVGDHMRRLTAYALLQSFLENSARSWLQEITDEDRDQHREYGDAALIRDIILAALLGEDQDLVVDSAEDFDPELEGQEPVEGEEALKQNSAEARAAWQLQEWFRKWAEDEKLPLKIIETERNAVGLGDGVYTLGWSTEKGRVRLRVWDPGFYFPVLDDGNEDDFPTRVHMAWEMPRKDTDTKVRIRRITWELRRIEGASYRYPWNDGPTDQVCLLSDGIWTVDEARDREVDDLDPRSAVWQTDDDGEIFERPIGIDFIPVIHMPNTVSILNHYGQSSLAKVLQILDDLANADTDMQAASAVAGKPISALSGAVLGSAPVYRAGAVWQVGENGRLDVIDMSAGLKALMEYVSALLARLSVNARLPESVLGRVKPSEVPSGVALALSFGPLASMIQEMRLVRYEKYPLLLKFVWRMSVAARAKGVPSQFVNARMQFGSYLPQDQAAAVEMAVKMLSTDPPTASLETVVRMLQGVGVPIEDVNEEIRRIQNRDFEGASALLDATGDEAAVFEYLDREPPPEGTSRPVPPAPEIPPTGVPPVRPDLGGQGG